MKLKYTCKWDQSLNRQENFCPIENYTTITFSFFSSFLFSSSTNLYPGVHEPEVGK